jgi:cell division protein FtsZ
MIELTRFRPSAAPSIKVLGLGGAGCNVLDRLILDGFDVTQTVALNTDLQALNGSVAPEKIHLGKLTTRGLGAGGDPELGYSAAEEATDEIAAVIGASNMVFVCAGLGGGTGSGAAPLVAHLARKAGATVIALVTLPFNFEGRRRGAQATEALAQLEQQAHIVLCFENDAMGTIVAPTAGIQQAFVATDQTLSQAIRALVSMVDRRGLVNIGLDDLTAAFGRGHAGTRCLFGHGESDSANRAHEAIERALRNPLMDKGRMLADAQQVLVHVAGGTELTLNEVTVLMEEFNRHISETTRVSFGVASDAKLGRRISVSILCANVPAVEHVAAVKVSHSVPIAPLPERKPAPAPEPVLTVTTEEFFSEAELPRIEPELIPAREVQEHAVAAKVDAPVPAPAPVVTPATKKYAPAAAVAASTAKSSVTSAKKEERAEQMTLEPANRGRFEKSEPTIVDGEDLDVPTFLRKTARR